MYTLTPESEVRRGERDEDDEAGEEDEDRDELRKRSTSSGDENMWLEREVVSALYVGKPKEMLAKSERYIELPE
jgi:hypothetical protein